MNNLALIKYELEGIMGENETFQADDVVNFARNNPRSAIREEFDRRNLFNDKNAADLARLAFARQLIQRVRVRIIRPAQAPASLRVFVNLTKERKTDQAGYRERKAVLSDEERQQMFREEFSRDIETLINRYADLLNADQEARLREVAADIAGSSLV